MRRILLLSLLAAGSAYSAELRDRPLGMTDTQLIAADPATLPDGRTRAEWELPATPEGSSPLLPWAVLLALALQLVYDRSFKEFSCRTRC